MSSRIITCPECGYKAEEQVGFSLLAAGFNGIKKGDPDDVNKLECGKCQARFDPPDDAEEATKNYRFTIVLNGLGKTPDEAWQDAIEGFIQDPGPTPGADEYEVEEA